MRMTIVPDDQRVDFELERANLLREREEQRVAAIAEVVEAAARPLTPVRSFSSPIRSLPSTPAARSASSSSTPRIASATSSTSRRISALLVATPRSTAKSASSLEEVSVQEASFGDEDEDDSSDDEDEDSIVEIDVLEFKQEQEQFEDVEDEQIVSCGGAGPIVDSSDEAALLAAIALPLPDSPLVSALCSKPRQNR